MTKNWYSYVCLFVLAVTLFSCNKELNKVMKSNDMDSKMAKAKEFYNNGDCFKAIPLFEEIIAYYKGSRDMEEIYYSYSYCQYAQRDYVIAAYHFKRFTELYPRSEKVQDAAFMSAKCYHEQSPKYNLDQTPTIEAIQKYQAFTEMYPNSIKIPEANQAIDELRLKLHKKAYASAKLYFKLKEYQAAAASFKNLVKEFPEFKDAEDAYYHVVVASKLLADNSYTVKKLERYEKTVEEFDIFKEKFPNSKYMKELENIYTKSLKEIESIKNKKIENESKS